MSQPKIAIIGLGYVGLPLAVQLSKHYTCTGFDVNSSRIKELQSGFDRTSECTEETLKSAQLDYSDQVESIKDHDVYIVTVPTPITDDNQPDLRALAGASKTVGAALRKNSIVVYESTVYPGVTEDYCAPILEEASGLKAGTDFMLGYSPERINPGDKIHTVDKITKVVAAQNDDTAKLLAEIYGSVNNGNIFIAKNIKTAEAAKVIENTQRDINIAFVNEITSIFDKIDVSIYDVLDAANTKWNFLNFQPGLVGGHCIGVDPYYLASLAQKLGEEPRIILSGRRINERMSDFIAKKVHGKLTNKQANILLLGLTFKENVPDLRNSKVPDLIEALRFYGHTVTVVDPLADKQEALEEYNIEILSSLKGINHTYDCILGCVGHNEFTALKKEEFTQLLESKSGVVVDIKRMWSEDSIPEDVSYVSL